MLPQVGLALLLFISVCSFVEPFRLGGEQLEEYIRHEAKLLDVTADQLISSCTVAHMRAIPLADYQRAMMLMQISKFKKNIRGSRGKRWTEAELEEGRRERFQYETALYKDRIRILNETAVKLSRDSSTFLSMASKEFIAIREQFLGWDLDNTNTTVVEPAYTTIAQAWNKVVTAYNQLSTKDKKEIEKTFCLRALAKGILTEFTTNVQDRLDDIATEKFENGVEYELVFMEAIGGYE